ncbi:MAG: hypothetical protein R3B70_10355 [Polyangiaceae bacterium]
MRSHEGRATDQERAPDRLRAKGGLARDTHAPGGFVVPYEKRLAIDPRWALTEGGKFFEGESAVQKAAARVTKRLNELGIPYAIAGGMALFRHGYRRFTEDVHILVTREGLARIHASLEGRGYLPPYRKAKNLRDTELGVKIEFLLAGDYPGDGKPKPVAFPDPSAVSHEHEGASYLNLPTLVELKLASGMTNAERIKDLADVQELIKLLALPGDFAEQLAPFVQAKFVELWSASRQLKRRYVRPWRNKFLTLDASSVDDMIATLEGAAAELRAMRADGVELDPEGGTADDYAYLVTTDPEIARKYDMEEEEIWDEHEGDPDEDGSRAV